MSTTTVSYSATSEEISLRELRRKEEEARIALRRRLGQAQKAIAAREAHYAALVEKLDGRRVHLPDLAFTLPNLPSIPAGQDPSAFERYAKTLDGLLEQYENQVRQAIADAEVVLERRKQLAAVWNEIHTSEAEIAVRNQACAALAQHLSERFAAQAPLSLNEKATLEEVQTHLKKIHATLAQLQAQHASLTSRVQSREKAYALRGNTVAAVSFGERQAAWETEKSSHAREQAKININAALVAAKLDMAALPIALQLQAEFALKTPQADAGRQLADQINRHRVRLDSIAKAEQVLAEPPQYADDSTGAMRNRWANLVKQLETVVCGLAEWSASLELEYHQIQQDCTHAMQRAYAKANFFEGVADSDFQVSDVDDGLVLMDLEAFPGYRIELENIATNEGYATVAELKADPSVSGTQDAEVTEVVCRKWQALAKNPDAKVNLDVAEHERKSTVTRSRRPVKRQARSIQL